MRLVAKDEFEHVVTKGRKVVGKELLLWSIERRDRAQTRFGTSISRKLGGAARRNRIKRLLREAFRLRRDRIKPGYDLVAYPRPGCGWKNLDEAEESLMGLCRKSGVLEDI